jgi:hypothetical protein
MGFTVSIPEERRVIILDRRNDLSEETASTIVHYLFEEGFIDESEEIICEVISE